MTMLWLDEILNLNQEENCSSYVVSIFSLGYITYNPEALTLELKRRNLE